jgi:hypothetical protein
VTDAPLLREQLHPTRNGPTATDGQQHTVVVTVEDAAIVHVKVSLREFSAAMR